MSRYILGDWTTEVLEVGRLVLATRFLRGAEITSSHNEVENVLGIFGSLLIGGLLELLFLVAIHAITALKIAVYLVEVNLRIEFASVTLHLIVLL